MQGTSAHPPHRLHLHLHTDDIVLTIDDDSTHPDPAALTRALDHPRVDVWSAATTPPGVPFDSLHLWLASQSHPYALLTADHRHATRLGDPQNWTACPTLIGEDSYAYLATRKIDDAIWQFGAHGFGPHSTTLTTDLHNLISRWDRDHRHGPGPSITVHTADTTPHPTRHPRLVLRRRHTTIAVTWPPTSPGGSRRSDRPARLRTRTLRGSTRTRPGKHPHPDVPVPTPRTRTVVSRSAVRPPAHLPRQRRGPSSTCRRRSFSQVGWAIGHAGGLGEPLRRTWQL
ncbi:hypothetical protein [Micromonospora sp. NBRC 107095]|uniref:hypothetical protein n=1 Tax=Micromonospora sp. NBRC 107095 TaxID=3032209 RepID=UPI0024A10290|nr:hypothetical protein [Micromonospora sp. NBRC 107095]GLZ60939.1 hypothetical protein Misp05_45150 [Micromonospora sp. NBRC 107095]